MLFRTLPAPPAALWLVAALLAVVGLGCGEKKPKKPTVDFLAQPEKVDFSQVPVAAPPPETPATVVADTWASRIREQVKLAHDDLQRCRNDFMIPFQFDKMRRRDVEWLSISEMDELCLDGNAAAKRRGPWKIVRALAEEHLGRNPALDRFIVLATDQMEHFRLLSFMTKKVGAPDIPIVTDTAREARDRVLLVGGDLDKAAAEVSKWPDGLQPDDDPQVVGKDVDLATFQQQLVAGYGFYLSGLGAAYDQYANKSWLGYNMPKMTALRRWIEVPTRRLAQDRARLARVQGANEKQLTEIRAFFDSVDKAVQTVAAGFDRYEKQSKDERGEKDPNRKALEAAQKVAVKFLVGWGMAAQAAK